MIGMGVLKGLLATAPAPSTIAEGLVHVDVDTGAAMYAARKIDLSTIACLADGDLAAGARRAIEAGLDIVWVGMAPKDVKVGPEGFTAIVAMRIDGEASQRSILVRGDVDNRITSASEIGIATNVISRLEDR